MKTTLFTSNDISLIVQHAGLDRLMDDTISGITDACLAYDPATFDIPLRGGYRYGDKNPGLLEWMPAMKANESIAIKMVGYHPHNPAHSNLPTILSTILTFDTSSGHLTSLMDGIFVTALRTGAASAVASKILAPSQSSVLGLIGCGAQAITQLHALSRVFAFDTVMYFDTDPQTCNSFSKRVESAGLGQIKLQSQTPEKIITAAHILCTATSIPVGQGPLFEDTLLHPSIHINAVGSDFPGKIELPRSLLKRSLVCPDFEEQAMTEGECQQLSADEIGPDLPTLVKCADKYESYQRSATVFDSTGWALEDYVVSTVIAKYGKEIGCGETVALENISDDPKNPYKFSRPNSYAETSDKNEPSDPSQFTRKRSQRRTS